MVVAQADSLPGDHYLGEKNLRQTVATGLAQSGMLVSNS